MVIIWYDMLVTVWCAVPFQNFVVIPNVLEVCDLQLQLVERCLIVFFPLLQLIVYRCKVYADPKAEEETRYADIRRPHVPAPLLPHSYLTAWFIMDTIWLWTVFR